MEEKKYGFTGETMIFEAEDGKHTLQRIIAKHNFENAFTGVTVKAGDLGGWVEKEENLSHEGACWLFDESKALGNAEVYHDAVLHDRACISGNAKACDKAWLLDDVKVHENAMIFGHCVLYDKAVVCGRANVHGGACLHGYVHVSGHANIYGDSEVGALQTMQEETNEQFTPGQVRVDGDARIYDNALVIDNAIITGNAEIFGNANILDNSVISENVKVGGNTVIMGDTVLKGDMIIKGSVIHQKVKREPTIGQTLKAGLKPRTDRLAELEKQ